MLDSGSENRPSLLDIVRRQEKERERRIQENSPEPPRAAQQPQASRQPQREELDQEPDLREPVEEKKKGKWGERGGGITIKGETIERFAQKFKKKPKQELTREGKQKRNKKVLNTIFGTGGVVAAGVAVSQALRGRQEAEQDLQQTALIPNVFGESGKTQEEITQNQYADYNFQQIGNIGLERTGIHLKDLSDPRALINKPFLRLAAKFGDDFLAPPVVDKDGKVVLEVSEAVVANWIEALNLNLAAAADFRQKYVHYRTHPDEFGQFLLENGASPTVVDFLSKAEELKLQDTDPATWLSNDPSNPDRYEKLQQWLQGKGIVIGKIEGKTDLPKVAEVKRGDEVGVVDETRINELVVWAYYWKQLEYPAEFD